MFCGLDIELFIGFLESFEVEGCRIFSYYLTEIGKNWIEREEWCLLDMEFWFREFIGLEKEFVGESKELVEFFSFFVMFFENKVLVEFFSFLVMFFEMSEEEVFLVGGFWILELEIISF